jgi:DNA (cytosine-5)-methyltransferase 1
MARLQTFPDDVTIVGSIADVQRQLGNAVPSLLAEILAREIAHQLLGQPPRPETRLAITKATTPPPPAKRAAGVPKRYLNLRGKHAAHPGTGKGYRALTRSMRHQEPKQLVAEPSFVV